MHDIIFIKIFVILVFLLLLLLLLERLYSFKGVSHKENSLLAQYINFFLTEELLIDFIDNILHSCKLVAKHWSRLLLFGSLEYLKDEVFSHSI